MSSLMYNIKQGFTQIVRNRGMSLASVFSIIAMLVITGVFFSVVCNLNLFTEVVKQDYDKVEVYLEDQVAADQAVEIMNDLNNQTGVKDTAYRSKDDAMDILKERWGDSAYLLDSLGKNPLPASILVTVDTQESAGTITKYAETISGVNDVKYYRETVEKLTKVTDGIQIAAIILMIFLIIVSVVVVSNTVKLTVFAREKEIKIMRYIGATNWFIRGPFLSEGIIIGILGAIISTGIVTFIYDRVLAAFGEQILAIVSCPLISVEYMVGNMFIIFLALGISIGAWGSIISMRKFLEA